MDLWYRSPKSPSVLILDWLFTVYCFVLCVSQCVIVFFLLLVRVYLKLLQYFCFIQGVYFWPLLKWLYCCHDRRLEQQLWRSRTKRVNELSLEELHGIITKIVYITASLLNVQNMQWKCKISQINRFRKVASIQKTMWHTWFLQLYVVGLHT